MKTKIIILLSIITLSASCYFYIPKAQFTFITLFGIHSFQFILMILLLKFLKQQNHSFLFWSILTAGILVRALIVFTDPIFENDFWRYMWDGRVLANGINPYLYIPEDPKLDHLGIYYRHLVGWKQYTTIYPPFSQLQFALSHIIFPDSLLGLKFILLLFDLGIFLILFFWLKKLKPQSVHLSAVYFLNPLVLKEIANSAHLDTIPVFFSLLAFYFFYLNKKIFSVVALGIATCSKIFPLILFPILIKNSKYRLKLISVFLIVISALYFPFILSGLNIFGGTKAFANYWEFNASVFSILDYFHDKFVSIFSLGEILFFKLDYSVKILIAGILLMWSWRVLKIKSQHFLFQVTSILSAILILSPVVDPWYILWILPFAILTQNLPWILFSFLVSISYAWFEYKDYFNYFKALEYTLFFTSFLFLKKTKLPGWLE